MSKTANKPEGVEFPSFDASKATEQFRSFAAKGAEQTKEAYDLLKKSSEETRKAFEVSYEKAKAASDELVLKSISAMREGSEANFAQFEALIGARSVSEFVELQSSFLRKQIELAIGQAKEFQGFTEKAVTEVIKPVKDAFEKTLKEAAA